MAGNIEANKDGNRTLSQEEFSQVLKIEAWVSEIVPQIESAAQNASESVASWGLPMDAPWNEAIIDELRQRASGRQLFNLLNRLLRERKILKLSPLSNENGKPRENDWSTFLWRTHGEPKKGGLLVTIWLADYKKLEDESNRVLKESEVIQTQEEQVKEIDAWISQNTQSILDTLSNKQKGKPVKTWRLPIQKPLSNSSREALMKMPGLLKLEEELYAFEEKDKIITYRHFLWGNNSTSNPLHFFIINVWVRGN